MPLKWDCKDRWKYVKSKTKREKSLTRLRAVAGAPSPQGEEFGDLPVYSYNNYNAKRLFKLEILEVLSFGEDLGEAFGNHLSSPNQLQRRFQFFQRSPFGTNPHFTAFRGDFIRVFHLNRFKMFGRHSPGQVNYKRRQRSERCLRYKNKNKKA
jgi:hypothetical protein